MPSFTVTSPMTGADVTERVTVPPAGFWSLAAESITTALSSTVLTRSVTAVGPSGLGTSSLVTKYSQSLLTALPKKSVASTFQR